MQAPIEIVRSDWQTALRPAPEGVAITAIGDVHGQAHLLERLHAAIAVDLAALSFDQATVIHLGDYIDRGPANVRSLELVRNGIPGTHNVVLIGNHEDLLLTVLRTSRADACEKWLSLGGTAVLAELGIDPTGPWVEPLRSALGENVIEWLGSLSFLHRIGELVFVHGGLKPGKALDALAKHECIWIWDEWIADDGPYAEGVGVIHGHIPVEPIDSHHPHKLNLDTRAYATGCLSAVLILGDRMRLIQAAGTARNENVTGPVPGTTTTGETVNE